MRRIPGFRLAISLSGLSSRIWPNHVEDRVARRLGLEGVERGVRAGVEKTAG
jgi:hypothetical protein